MTSRDELVNRFLDLIRRKTALETQIVQHTQELAEAYEAVKADLQAVLDGRSEEIDDAIKTLKDFQVEGECSAAKS
jgi:vacuolar-type H+-ATPase subunit D/Vma8